MKRERDEDAKALLRQNKINKSEGMKTCRDCMKTKPITEFKPSQGICTDPCEKLKRNVMNAAQKEGMMAWFDEQYADPKKWKRVRAWWMQRAPNLKKKERSFPILTFQGFCRAEEQKIKDGEYEMMHEAAFIEFAKKPKNYPPRGLSEDESKAKFKELGDDPLASTDQGGVSGHNGRYLHRVAIKTKGKLIQRELT